jgi:DNA-binding transcriptional LysR family regulator
MELMQLEMLVAVVEERSVCGAAERVCRTPPAVSIAMRKLEEEFNSPLFDRSKRYEYRLTQVGQVLYEYAFHILALRDEALSVLQSEEDNFSGTLRYWMNQLHAPKKLHDLAVPPTGSQGSHPRHLPPNKRKIHVGKLGNDTLGATSG